MVNEPVTVEAGESRGDEARGDPATVIQAEYPGLLATARRLASSRSEAEDLVQESLVRTLARHPDFAGVASPAGYLRTVLYRLAFAHARRRWAGVPLETQEQLRDPAPDADARVGLIEGLATLGPRQRACVELRFLHGMDDDAIAAALGCRSSTVRSQIARALAHLRDRMEETDDDDT
jgi:RNA polymerase sigma factor (sigma-70 family)